jgi:hypothetical protein
MRATGRALTDAEKDVVLQAVGEAWKAQPELRLGQLLAVWAQFHFTTDMDEPIIGRRKVLDGLFFIEDGDLAHNLKLYAEQNGKGVPAPLQVSPGPGKLQWQAGSTPAEQEGTRWSRFTAAG